MARPPRPTPPSAIDGFRRLERTRTVATPSEAIAATATFDERPSTRRRPGTGRRVAGALRLLAFVAALVIVVGTSVSLAGSGGDEGPRVEPAASSTVEDTSTSSSPDASTSQPEAVDDVLMAESSDAPSEEDTVVADEEPTTIAAAAVPDAAPAPSPSRSLPFTDSVDMQRLLLAGSALLLLGMLVQVAGQPLPAQNRR